MALCNPPWLCETGGDTQSAVPRAIANTQWSVDVLGWGEVKPLSLPGSPWALLAAFQAPLPNPGCRIGLQRKPLFGLLMAFAVSRAAQAKQGSRADRWPELAILGGGKLLFLQMKAGEVCGG